jgi:hypothetical protein
VTITVIVASNTTGAVEVFAFHRRRDAERWAQMIEGKGTVEAVLVYADIELIGQEQAARMLFPMKRALRAVDEEVKG